MTPATDTREEETGLSLTELMMLPVILLWMTFQVFAQHVVKLKEMRRTRPLPKNWQEHYGRLRIVEWHIRQLTASGVEQILVGQDLDLHQLWMNPDPPEEFGQMPASAWEMHRRFEAIARFHADPERYIRRAARRILARDGEPDPFGRADPRSESRPVATAATADGGGGGGGGGVLFFGRRHPAARSATPAQPIRAPPGLIPNRKNKSTSNPPTASARTRDHA